MNEKAVLIKGKSGSFKTTGVLFEKVNKMIENGENILMLDSKEEYYKRFSKKMKDNGYNIITLNLKDPTKGNGYNPYTLPYLYYQDGNFDRTYELLERIGGELFTDRSYNSDPFWENAASDLFMGLSILLFKNAPIEKINLGSASIAVDLCSEDIMKNYASKLRASDPEYMCLSGTLFAPFETKASILSVTKQKLKLYCLRENLMNMLSFTDFDIKNLGKEKTAIFVIARDDSRGINDIANMFIEQVFSLVVFENVKFNFVLDNIETLNPITVLANMIDMLSDKMKIYVAVRNEGFVKEQYNCPNLFDNITSQIETEKEEFNYSEYTDDVLELPKNNLKASYFDVKSYLESLK